MMMIILTSWFICLTVGLVLHFLLKYFHSTYDVTWAEFSITSAITSLVVIPLITILTWKGAVNSKITYNEYWNGWETQAELRHIQCHRDGSCIWCYDCDPYIVSYPCNCTKNGCSVCFRTEYHHCPYVTEEWNFYIQTTLGPFTVDEGRFPNHYQPWRESEPVPTSIANRAGVGYPNLWMEAKLRLDSLHPGPVTQRHHYENFLYASDFSILKNNSQNVFHYSALSLLPPLDSNIYNLYLLKKVYFVGMATHDEMLWIQKMNYMASALGSLQGDVRLVVVKDSLISNPDNYVLALKAYWQSNQKFGRNAIAKNAMILIVGTNGTIVTWARAFSTMPSGNELFITEARTHFTGMPLIADSIIGNVYSDSLRHFHYEHGMAEMLMKEPYRYTRVPMANFKYLKSEIEPSAGTVIFLYILSAVLSAGSWLIPVFMNENWESNPYRYGRRYY